MCSTALCSLSASCSGMQTRGLAKWFSEQNRRTRGQLKASRCPHRFQCNTTAAAEAHSKSCCVFAMSCAYLAKQFKDVLQAYPMRARSSAVAQHAAYPVQAACILLGIRPHTRVAHYALLINVLHCRSCKPLQRHSPDLDSC